MITDNSQPIGIFDSGVGGLSVLKEALKVLPEENYIYYGDTKNIPYGDKTVEQLKLFTKNILDYFKAKNVKAVLCACNTSSANTLHILREYYDFKIFGLIEPTSDYVNSLNVSRVRLIATSATVKSEAYKRAIEKSGKKLFSVACPKLVGLIEKGELLNENTKQILSSYLAELEQEKIEKLILGCTHYPFLVPLMKTMGYKDDFFINPAICLIKDAYNYLKENNLLNTKRTKDIEFFISANREDFMQKSKLFLDINSIAALK